MNHKDLSSKPLFIEAIFPTDVGGDLSAFEPMGSKPLFIEAIFPTQSTDVWGGTLLCSKPLFIEAIFPTYKADLVVGEVNNG